MTQPKTPAPMPQQPTMAQPQPKPGKPAGPKK